MANLWRTVRIFISSTFRDMHAERDHLIKRVFPELRQRLEAHRIHLVDIDLRWGVTAEQADNDEVLDVCLQQIDECRPFFLGILGGRYGWVPTEFPANAVSKYGWVQQHTGKSITELEILYGVLNDAAMRDRSFFFFRDPQATNAIPDPLRSQTFAETDPEMISKLDKLKDRIRQSGCAVMDPYPAAWDPEEYDRPTKSHGRLGELDAFGEQVEQWLWEAICSDLKLDVESAKEPEAASSEDSETRENDLHERFLESRVRVYIGRQTLQDQLTQYANGAASYPCLVTGPSGSGKSAALAKFVTAYRKEYPDAQVLAHFVGASPQSTSLRNLLRRLCTFVAQQANVDEEIPQDIYDLTTKLREWIAQIPDDRHTVIVIDALNQLDESDNAHLLYWLPRDLPAHVHVIVSCIDEDLSGSHGEVQANSVESVDHSQTDNSILDAFEHRPKEHIEVEPLTDTERLEIVREIPSLSAKTLDAKQVELLLSNPATTNPLFLLVALEELRGFGSFEQLNERIQQFPREGDTVTAIFDQVIDRLEEDFDQTLAKQILSLLASARRGLSEYELQELVESLEEADELFPVLRQVRPYLQARGELLDFHHRSFFKAVRARHLATSAARSATHSQLADYFRDQDYFCESLEEQRARAKRLPPTPRPVNIRKVDELPFHVLEVAKLADPESNRPDVPQWDAVADLLTDWHFLEAKAEALL